MFEQFTPWPDARGRFGDFGGCYVPEVLVPALEDLRTAWETAAASEEFADAYEGLLRDVVGRPSLLTEARRLSDDIGARILLKREDLNHTGAHKINNTLGQALLCQRMGKKRVIAETGAGQHGVATATACALFGFDCTVYMGAEDVARQALNVDRMRLLGAKVEAVQHGTKTLKDAMNEAMRDWVTHVDTTYYMVGSAAGPHPYPKLVRDLQAVIGLEVKEQMSGAMPDALVACVGGGSNAIGLFYPFIPDAAVTLIGAEAAGEGLSSGAHSASLACGTEGILHGARTMVLQESEGQISRPHSFAPGLDYPAVGPEHAWLHRSGRGTYVAVDDETAIEALQLLARREGILCALESAHAVSAGLGWGKEHQGSTIVIEVSGRGDKDMPALSARLGATI